MDGCYLYLRVSSEDQISNFSLDTQKELCNKEAQRRQYTVLGTYREEGKSATTIDGRPELLRMLGDCRKNSKGIRAVIVYRLDRLSRQTSDFLAIRTQLAKSAISVVSASEPTGSSPTEQFVETLLASVAELDNRIRAERAKNGLRKRFESGLPLGPIPIGYCKTDDVVWQPDPETWDKMKQAWELMSTGNKSLREMARLMNSMGLRTTVGLDRPKVYKLRPQSLSRIFSNKLYAGYLNYFRTYAGEVKSQVPPMVTEEMFYKVQAILEGRNNTPLVIKRVRDREEFPLRRLVKCSKCGAALTAGWSKGKNKRYSYYLCSGDSKHKSIPSGDLDKAVIELLDRTKPTPEAIQLFNLVVERNWNGRISLFEARRKQAGKEILLLKETQLALVEKNLNGTYSDGIYREMNAKLEDKLLAARVVSSENLISKYTLEEVTNFTTALFTNPAKAYQQGDLYQKRELLCSIWSLGLTWIYPGISNTQISPIYQVIREGASAQLGISEAGGT